MKVPALSVTKNNKMYKDLIEKALSKATGLSQNDIKNAGSVTVKQATEAIQWALDTNVDNILGSLREQLKDMNDPRDQKHTYGFELAVNLVNDNFTE